MPHMLITLETSHLEISPVNLFALGNSSLLNNWLMSVTSDTSQDPIGPCGPLEQSVDSCRHSLTAAWSAALDFGSHSAVRYYCKCHMIIRVRFRVSFRTTVRVRLVDRGRARAGGLSLLRCSKLMQ